MAIHKVHVPLNNLFAITGLPVPPKPEPRVITKMVPFRPVSRICKAARNGTDCPVKDHREDGGPFTPS